MTRASCRAVRAAALACVLIATGCGGPDRADFIRRADQICQAIADRTARDLGGPVTPRKDARRLAQRGDDVVAFSQRQREKLGLLRRPNRLGDKVRTYLRHLDDALLAQREAVKAARRGDVKSASQLLEQRERAAAQTSKPAAEIGLRVCGRP